MENVSFKEYILDQFQALSGIVCRPMFGGHGLYWDGTFFGMLHKGRLYFKTNETSLPDFLKKGMKPFRPNRKQTLKTYYEVPVDVIEDNEELVRWAGYAARRIPPKA